MELKQIDSEDFLVQATPSRNDGYELDLLDVALAFTKRRRLILALIALGAVAATAIAFLLPSRFISTTKILPPQQPPSAAALTGQLVATGLGSLPPGIGKDLGLKNSNDIYVGILKSRTISDAIIKEFGLQDVYRDTRLSDARKDLGNATGIEVDKEGLVSISVEDKDPTRAAAMANAYVEHLRQLTQVLAVTEAGQRRLFFERQLKQARDDLANAEVALRDTQIKSGFVQLDSQAKAIIEAVAQVRGQIGAKEVEIQAMKSFAAEQNPEKIRAEQELAALRTQLAKLENQPGVSGDPLINLGKVPSLGLEYVRRVRDVKYYEAMFELLARQFEAAKLDEAREGAIVQVVDVADVPDRRSSPKRLLIVAVGIFLGLLGGLAYCTFSEGLKMLASDPRNAARLRILKGPIALKKL